MSFDSDRISPLLPFGGPTRDKDDSGTALAPPRLGGDLQGENSPLKVTLREIPSRKSVRCPACRETLYKPARKRVSCSACNIGIHQACVRMIRGCPTLGCSGVIEKAIPETMNRRRSSRKRSSLNGLAMAAVWGVALFIPTFMSVLFLRFTLLFSVIFVSALYGGMDDISLLDSGWSLLISGVISLALGLVIERCQHRNAKASGGGRGCA